VLVVVLKFAGEGCLLPCTGMHMMCVCVCVCVCVGGPQVCR